MNVPDPLMHAESMLKHVHQQAERRLRPAHKRYPTLFLFLIAFSAAALFHGLDEFLNQFSLFHRSPLILAGIGVFGLLITGSLYKRLGKDS